MSTTNCGICGKAHLTSECVNVTVQYECPCCERDETKGKEQKCVCPACERQLACKEEEFRTKCQCLAEEKHQEELKRLEELRACEEEKCMAEQRKQFMDDCVKEQKALIEQRKAELEKCRELEQQTFEECECEGKHGAQNECEDTKPKVEQCSNDLTTSMENLKLQCSKVMRCPTDKDECDNGKNGSNNESAVDCPPGAEKFAKCVAKCASSEMSKDDCAEVASKAKTDDSAEVKEKEDEC